MLNGLICYHLSHHNKVNLYLNDLFACLLRPPAKGNCQINVKALHRGKLVAWIGKHTHMYFVIST